MDALDDELAQQRVRAMVHERLFGSPAPPTIIGRYRVIRRLGVGAMGVVYAARDQALGRLVAVKVLHGHLDREGGEPRARLLREARALARLSHPNVVAVHEVGTHEGQVFLAMEYVAGPTLGAWIREARPPWRAIVQVFVQAGRGLQAAHAAGLVHRDFKPDNVLVDRTGRARVLDFGLVRPEEGRAAPITADGDELGPLTRSGAIVGTPAYMSPEQLRGEALDPRSDLFSFCVALHEALVGARPFDLYHEAGLREVAVGTTQEGAAPRLPRRLRRALDRGLARDRERRPPTMEPLLRELEGAATPALQRWEPRIGGALGVVALAALIGVGARADGAASRGAAVVPRIAHLRLVGEHARFRSADGAQSPKTRDRARLLAAERLLGSDPSAAAVVLAGLEAPDEVAARSSLGRLVDALLAEPLAESERWVRATPRSSSPAITSRMSSRTGSSRASIYGASTASTASPASPVPPASTGSRSRSDTPTSLPVRSASGVAARSPWRSPTTRPMSPAPMARSSAGLTTARTTSAAPARARRSSISRPTAPSRPGSGPTAAC
ncbi:MAG: protein kinase [Nannocystaceae bacterium]